jgi:small subunit ribosomal protein S8
MRHDIISDVFNLIKNAEAVGRHECTIPASSLIKSVLKIMQQHEYIEGFTMIEDGRGGKLKVKLHGRINDCNSIRPRFSAKKADLVKFEKRFLPASGTGILIMSTSEGVIDHKQAKKTSTGGKLLGFVY